MFWRMWELIEAIWLHALLGSGLMVVGACAGWALASASSFPLVQFIERWLRLVVVRLFERASWLQGTAVVFVNNISVFAVLLVLSRWQVAALFGVAGLGVSLGIGLRILSSGPTPFGEAEASFPPRLRRRLRVGLTLNLLEPLAIMLTIGLALSRSVAFLPAADVWIWFGILVAPITFVAAAGEALWITAYRLALVNSDLPSHSSKESNIRR